MIDTLVQAGALAVSMMGVFVLVYLVVTYWLANRSRRRIKPPQSTTPPSPRMAAPIATTPRMRGSNGASCEAADTERTAVEE